MLLICTILRYTDTQVLEGELEAAKCQGVGFSEEADAHNRVCRANQTQCALLLRVGAF